MCFAIPGKIIEINGNEVIVDYEVEKRKARALFDVEKGEYVIVNSGIIIKKVPEKDALETIEFVKSASKGEINEG